MGEASSKACLHCSEPVGNANDSFCCTGCSFAYALLKDENLLNYYSLKDNRPSSKGQVSITNMVWLDEWNERFTPRVNLHIQGVHCSACIWVIEKLFHKEPGAESIQISSHAGTIHMQITTQFPLQEFVFKLQHLGYQLAPISSTSPSTDSNQLSRALLWRFGVTLAIAMNIMMFSIAMYLGLDSGPIHALMSKISMVLATLSTAIGLSWFGKKAIGGLRAGVMHFDLPISLGILSAYSGSMIHAIQGGGNSYLDTVCVFITLMFLGKFVQERVLQKNRSLLMQDAGFEHIKLRHIADPESAQPHLSHKHAHEFLSGDTFVSLQGELCPFNSMMVSHAGLFRLDWINGESEPVHFKQGDLVPSGAIQISHERLWLQAQETLETSSLKHMFQSQISPGILESPFWKTLSSHWSIGVILVAVITGLLRAWIGDSVHAILESVTAVLVVSCPCAFGIATPLAYDTLNRKLRIHGLYVRNSHLLDTIPTIQSIVFDKTGTLTLTTLEVKNKDALESLSNHERSILKHMVQDSIHPKSMAIHAAIDRSPSMNSGSNMVEGITEEIIGKGISFASSNRRYRLGNAHHVECSLQGDTFFACDGNILATFDFEETLKNGAKETLEHLSSYPLYVFSGDSTSKVTALAQKLHLNPLFAFGGLSPQEKKELLLKHAPKALFIGDGMNDFLASQTALASISANTDRPFLASHSDAFLMSSSLKPIRFLIDGSRILHSTVKHGLGLSLLYNISMVALAMGGHLPPWLAAVLMPASSVSVIALTQVLLKHRLQFFRETRP